MKMMKSAGPFINKNIRCSSLQIDITIYIEVVNNYFFAANIHTEITGLVLLSFMCSLIANEAYLCRYIPPM